MLLQLVDHLILELVDVGLGDVCEVGFLLIWGYHNMEVMRWFELILFKWALGAINSVEVKKHTHAVSISLSKSAETIRSDIW